MKKIILLFAFLPFLLFSCKTPTNISYFQDMNDEAKINEVVSHTSTYEIKIQPADLLSITVSSIDPNAVAVFNLPATSFLRPGQMELTTTPVLQSFLVDVKGCVDFPVIGKIEVSGLTRIELTDLLKEKISLYAKKPLVNVQILNFRVSVLGEVNAPGAKGISNEMVTILDAITMAGDLNIYGNRNNILLIRETNGKKEFHRFDLTSSDIFTSPYFYLKQNDVIYVEPNKAKQNASRQDSQKQFNISLASTLVGALSTIASLCIALFIK